MNDVFNIISLTKIKGFTRQKIRSTYTTGMSDDELIRLTGEDNFPEIKKRVKKELEPTIKAGGKAICFLNRQLKNLKDAPLVLFYKGNLTLLDKGKFRVAIIGTRNTTAEIEQRARMCVREISAKAITVSGLALGCDTIAHDETLRNNGKTIAILPSPIQNITPASNNDLAQEIVEKGGLLITEYYDEPANEYDMKGRYTDRDKLQALFSRGILLCASSLNGGSRIAMKHADKLNKPRAVIDYGDNSAYTLNDTLKSEKGVSVISSEEEVRKWMDMLHKKIEVVQLEMF